jgi:hypothetical protein
MRLFMTSFGWFCVIFAPGRFGTGGDRFLCVIVFVAGWMILSLVRKLRLRDGKERDAVKAV